ncbi:extracellular solute-binding protein [Bartonella sp. HY038]|uniref:extracellular solute-binding protein n=1 Tax=Bartonella sp. HY038 TaxID=2759660 RepID=UPI0015FCC9BB|nr:extracellular solute-binding protein [Bartonella sp. HY038]
MKHKQFKQFTASLILAGISIVSLSEAVFAQSKNLNLFVWADSVSPELIKKFEKETGIKVSVDGFTSNEDVLTKLQAGSSGYDLITPSQHFVKIMIDSNLLENVDMKSLPAFQQVDKKWFNQWWDPTNEYSFPFSYGTAGFTVNRDQYKGPIDSWKVYFEPSADLRGRIASLAQPDEVISAAQNYLGIPYCSENPAEMKKVLDLLKAQKDYVAVYSSDNIENRIGGGEVAMHFWWDGNSMRVRRNDKVNIEYAMPKEGLVGWMDSFVIPKNAPHKDNAIKFIEFMATQENATIQTNYYGHSSPLKIDESKAVNNKDVAPELFPTVEIKMQQACSPAAQDLVTKVWTQLLQ